MQVTPDGTISFGPEGPVPYDRAPEWPQGIPEERASLDKPFIAPFHYQAYRPTSPHTYTGRIHRSHTAQGFIIFLSSFVCFFLSFGLKAPTM